MTPLISSGARLIIKEIISTDPYAGMIKEERYSFLRTNAVYKKCMDFAHKKWRWVEKRLK